MWVAGSDNIWAVGHDGAFFDDGTTWRHHPITGKPRLGAVGGTSAKNVWAVGTKAYRFDGHTWSEHDPGVDQFLWGVWCSGPDNVWAVGDPGTVLHNDGND